MDLIVTTDELVQKLKTKIVDMLTALAVYEIQIEKLNTELDKLKPKDQVEGQENNE